MIYANIQPDSIQDRLQVIEAAHQNRAIELTHGKTLLEGTIEIAVDSYLVLDMFNSLLATRQVGFEIVSVEDEDGNSASALEA